MSQKHHKPTIMPFNISPLTVDPNPISMPGSTTISYTLSGTSGIKLQIENQLSESNNIVFSDGSKTLSGGQQTMNDQPIELEQTLDFISQGANQMISFFVTVRVTNIANGATKLQKIQMRIV